MLGNFNVKIKTNSVLANLSFFFTVLATIFIPRKPFGHYCIESLFSLYVFIVKAFKKIQPLHLLALVNTAYDALDNF